MCFDKMSFLTEIKWKFLFKHTYFRVCKNAIAQIDKNVIIRNSRIIVSPGASVYIENNVIIENVIIYIEKGVLTIGNCSRIGNPKTFPILNIEAGEVHIGHHSIITASRFWVRFGGVIKIGNYTNINSGSEIRCDESVTIGNYNQISYNIVIWDTNTHNILPVKIRRELAERKYPYLGKEESRPLTSPIVIGNDCWIGQNVSILKGTVLGNEVIIGYNCMLVGATIADQTTVVTDNKLKIFKR